MPLGFRNVVLIGFMGTGKSSVGRILARRLARPVVDIDHRIEQNQKRKIHDLFEKEGESFFRSLEKETIREAASGKGLVITTGGGAVLDPENVAALKRTGWLVALSARPETIYRRVKGRTPRRPLLESEGEDPLSRIRSLMERRRPFYRCADLEFETDGKSAAQVAKMILTALERK